MSNNQKLEQHGAAMSNNKQQGTIMGNLVDRFLAGNTDYGSFFEFERRYDAELDIKEREDHVFHTSYEMLKKNTFDSMKQLGAFLAKERSDEFYRDVDKTSFRKVKERRDLDYGTR